MVATGGLVVASFKQPFVHPVSQGQQHKNHPAFPLLWFSNLSVVIIT